MIELKNLQLDPGVSERVLPALAARALKISEKDIRQIRITKKSLDARRKSDIHWIYSVTFPSIMLWMLLH